MTKKTRVIIAFGVDTREWTTHDEVIALLEARAPSNEPGRWEYHDKTRRLHVEVQVLYDKDGFAKALDTPDAIVVYDGHSRIGQGPAFGDAEIGYCPTASAYPLNPWGDHFRMGFDAVEIPCQEEILGHCTNPNEIPKAGLGKGPFLGGRVRQILSGASGKGTRCAQRGFARRPLASCYAGVARRVNGRGEKTLEKRDYWYSTADDFQTIVEVGDDDLATSRLACRVLFMNSCSSKLHFYDALKRHSRKVKSKCVFYMTRATNWAGTTKVFVRLLLDGHDPTSRSGRRKFVKAMNGLRGAGFIQFLR